MPKPVVRDNAYYLKRIEIENSKVWADWIAGKFGSVSEARRAAGMLSKRTPLHELKNAWNKATPAEHRDFLHWLGIGTAAPPAAPTVAPVAVDRQLEPWAKKRIEEIRAKRGMKMGDVMHELGFKRLNPSLGMALHRSAHLRPAVILALEKWLADNASV